jgi:hypothetical protein
MREVIKTFLAENWEKISMGGIIFFLTSYYLGNEIIKIFTE